MAMCKAEKVGCTWLQWMCGGIIEPHMGLLARGIRVVSAAAASR
eukprot:COSAG01_NODE_58496_length_305_cov_1.990291_1_plen_43_part_01